MVIELLCGVSENTKLVLEEFYKSTTCFWYDNLIVSPLSVINHQEEFKIPKGVIIYKNS